MNTLGFLLEVGITLVAVTTPIALIVRLIGGRRDSTFDGWPNPSIRPLPGVVPEENDPPHWRLDRLPERQRPLPADRDTRGGPSFVTASASR